MSAEQLRAAIEAVLRRRDPSSIVELRPVGGCALACLDSDITTGSTQHRDPVEALRTLARGHGLIVSDDGTVTDALDVLREYTTARCELLRLRSEAAALLPEVSERASFHCLTNEDRAWAERTRAAIRAAADRVTVADAALLALAPNGGVR